jgi:hypothetical protein
VRKLRILGEATIVPLAGCLRVNIGNCLVGLQQVNHPGSHLGFYNSSIATIQQLLSSAYVSNDKIPGWLHVYNEITHTGYLLI